MKSIRVLLLVYCFSATTSTRKPNIVIILADDLGWNDVSFHGSNQIPTPNIDALAYNGIILNRFYTQPSCTPSRAALLTGQYPTRIGFQGFVIKSGENRFLPHDVPLLPEKLKRLGYSTNLIGKWHLGFAYRNVTPTRRGFDYHFGYWNGLIGYFDHLSQELDVTGFDMHENLKPSWATQNQYATHLFSKKTEEVIMKHNTSKPLFLMVSHLAPHAGKRNIIYEVPDEEANDQKFHYIEDEKRRKYAGMVDELDKSIGELTQALFDKGILNETIIIFLSDNGAQPVGPTQVNTGSNWPLRGVRNPPYEGGIRCTAFLYYPKLRNKNFVYNGFVHITDLHPTLLKIAGETDANSKLDGVDQWDAVTKNGTSARREILVNIDEVENWSGIILDGFKLINGSGSFNQTLDGFYGENGRNHPSPSYNITSVLNSIANRAINQNLTEDVILKLRTEADLGNCRLQYDNHRCNVRNMCLFDIVNDPCETTDLFDKHPTISRKLSKRLSKYWNELVPQKNQPYDPRSNPIYFNSVWSNWLDEQCIGFL